jgi:hypothetical protein
VCAPIANAAARHVIGAVIPSMLAGGAVASIAGDIDDLATAYVRVNRVDVGTDVGETARALVRANLEGPVGEPDLPEQR